MDNNRFYSIREMKLGDIFSSQFYSDAEWRNNLTPLLGTLLIVACSIIPLVLTNRYFGNYLVKDVDMKDLLLRTDRIISVQNRTS